MTLSRTTSTAVGRPNAPTLLSLTSLRFFAALLVVFYHRGDSLHAYLPSTVSSIIHNGFVGVSFFFVLSGMILAHAYTSRAFSQNWFVFWRDRFARIYPAYAFSLLIALPSFLVAIKKGALPISLVLAPFLVQAWHPLAACSWNCPTWSLSVEALFYSLFPVILVASLRASARQLIWIFVGLCAAALVAPLLYEAFHVPETNGRFDIWTEGVKYNPALHLAEFAAGVIAVRLLRTQQITPTAARWMAGVGVLTVLALLMLPGGIPKMLLHNGLLIAPFVMVIGGLMMFEVKTLAVKWLVLLGEASYALYLLHIPIWDLMSKVAEAIGVSDSTVLFFFGYVTVSVVASVLTLKFIEEPAKLWIKRRWPVARSKAAA